MERTARTPRHQSKYQERDKAWGKETVRKPDSPPYQVFSLPAQMHVVRDNKVVRPIDDLLIRLVRGLRTEGRVSNETLKHDRAQGPPITLVSVSFLQENFGGDVIRRSDGRICLYKGETEIQFRLNYWGKGEERVCLQVSYDLLSKSRSDLCWTSSNG
jgi:hypothetical protein